MGKETNDSTAIQATDTTDTTVTVEPSDTTDTTEKPMDETAPNPVVLDLRPPAESAKNELLRLGLAYDRTDDTTGIELWRDYQRHLLAEFPSAEGTPVTITDTNTGEHATLDLEHLKTITRIIVSGETI